MSRYHNTPRLFARREKIKICKKALAKGPLTIRDLAVVCMSTKGLDPNDRVLAKSVAHTLAHGCGCKLTGATSLRAGNASA
jgi:hypothetical protein